MTDKERWDSLIVLYEETCKRLYNVNLGTLGTGAKSDYPSRLKRLYSFFGDQLIKWIDNEELTIAKKNIKLLNNPSQSQLSTAFSHFYKFVTGLVNGEKRLEVTVKPIVLAQIVANSAIFADVQTVEDVIEGRKGSTNNIKKGNIYASWDHCQSRRKHSGEELGSTYHDEEFGDVKLDSNNKANYMFKSAIAEMLKSKGVKITKFTNYTVCHIWDNCAHDNKFYTSIINMVLVPHALRSLTDYNEYVKDVLRYRSLELYKSLCKPKPHRKGLRFPVDINQIKKPSGYDTIKWA